MRVLALDTTTRGGSVALVDDEVVVDERAGDAVRSHAERLPSEILALLAAHDRTIADVELLAVASGPGSFTGLRIGIATMQGLAFGQGKPLVGVSALTALRAVASPAFLGSRIATWVDAWRGDVYAALFEDGREVGEPVVARPADLLDDLARGTLAAYTNDITFIGDGAETYRDLIVSRLQHAARIADPAVPHLAAVIAMLATIEYKNGHRPPPHAIRPLYVRRSDAELARLRGPQGSAPQVK
jgi:tRNA threonylcarbamoyladenosine biosynthesis protein TsaB